MIRTQRRTDANVTGALGAPVSRGSAEDRERTGTRVRRFVRHIDTSRSPPSRRTDRDVSPEAENYRRAKWKKRREGMEKKKIIIIDYKRIMPTRRLLYDVRVNAERTRTTMTSRRPDARETISQRSGRGVLNDKRIVVQQIRCFFFFFLLYPRHLPYVHRRRGV